MSQQDEINDAINEGLSLEKYLVKFEKGLRQLKENGFIEQYDLMVQHRSNASEPVGIGVHPTRGMFILCGGQGPFVQWSEWER